MTSVPEDIIKIQPYLDSLHANMSILFRIEPMTVCILYHFDININNMGNERQSTTQITYHLEEE